METRMTIRQRTGIEERRWVPERAAWVLPTWRWGFAHKRWNAYTRRSRPDHLRHPQPGYFLPGPGCLLQHKLGLDRTPALDIRQQCTGFLYGLTTADAYIRSGLARGVLLACAEVHSTGLDRSTRGRDVTVIFGDGAAAVCIEGAESERPVGILSSALHANELAES
jgi:3-oxoacyl-[acyl-carrier-protein] synthase-3